MNVSTILSLNLHFVSEARRGSGAGVRGTGLIAPVPLGAASQPVGLLGLRPWPPLAFAAQHGLPRHNSPALGGGLRRLREKQRLANAHVCVPEHGRAVVTSTQAGSRVAPWAGDRLAGQVPRSSLQPGRKAA